jgi:macrolide transport system ATP-binding/permease protein
MTANPPAIRFIGMSRRYGDRRQWFAIRNVTLDISHGDFIAVVGRSGSGKSTLLNVIALLDNAWDGSYELNGVDVKSLTGSELDQLRARTFGFVFQSSYANPYESTRRNAALGLAIQGTPPQQQVELVAAALRAVGLEDKAESLARSLSGGERQRLAIARAIATRPSIIVADEPTGNLDTETSSQVMEVFSELNRSGTTIILVTHDHGVAGYAHRRVQMRDGVLSDVTGSSNTGTQSIKDRADSVSQDSPRLALLRRSFERVLRAVNNVSSRPLRSFALIAAFAMAFSGLVGAAGIGISASQQIAERLTTTAGDQVTVNVPAVMPPAQRARWIAAIGRIRQVNSVGELAPIDAATARTTRFDLLPQLGGLPFSGTTVAADRALFTALEITTQPPDASRLFSAKPGSHVALVGTSIAETLGLSRSGGGAEIWVDGEPYTVVGIVTASPRAPNLLTSVIIPISTFPGSSSQLVVRTSAGYSGPVAKAIPLLLSPTAPGNVSVDTAGDLQNLRIGVQTDLNGLLGSLSVALLAIAILSGASAMYLSIQSRTQELALGRALGLSQLGVAAVFLWEGAVIGLSGALAGIAGGLAISLIVAAAQSWTAIAPVSTIAVAPILGIASGAIAALIPAIRAARVDPADAIR